MVARFYDLEYNECIDSFRNRMGLENDYGFTLKPNGSVNCTKEENDFCPLPYTYHAVKENQVHLGWRIVAESTCIPPYVYEDSGVDFSFWEGLFLYIHKMKEMSQDTLKTRNGFPLFPLVERFTVYYLMNYHFYSGFFSSEMLPSLNSIKLIDCINNTMSPDVFKGNENQITYAEIVLSELDLKQLFGNGLSSLKDLETLEFRGGLVHYIHPVVAALSELKYFHLLWTYTEYIAADSLCAPDRSSKLERFRFRDSPSTVFEDRVFTNCHNLIYIEITQNLFNETKQEFMERTGACSREDCVLYIS
eukprot:snap_masked-scaffold_25-processed-gene-5.26-mRNA-1 protein AED:1.00 eAED:1.00 QI:0/0/0/0/1/1/2/0/304